MNTANAKPRYAVGDRVRYYTNLHPDNLTPGTGLRSNCYVEGKVVEVWVGDTYRYVIEPDRVVYHGKELNRQAWAYVRPQGRRICAEASDLEPITPEQKGEPMNQDTSTVWEIAIMGPDDVICRACVEAQ